MKNIVQRAIGVVSGLCLTAGLVCSGISPAYAIFSATVSGTNMQTVKGWGCHAYDNSVASTVTQAFCVDLGMTVDRIQIAHDNTTDDQGNISTTNMDQVCNAITDFNNHGIKYIICSWGPNVGMKNPAIIGSADLRTDHEDQFTTYFINVCNYIKNKGLPLPVGLCIQNEPTTGATYDNMHFVNENNFDYSQYYRVIKGMRTKLNNNGYSAITLLGPEDGSYDTGNNWGCSLAFLGGNGFPALSADSTLNAAIGAFSSHSYYWGGGVGYLQQWASSCETWGRDKWQTEYSYIENGETNTPGIDVAVMGARRLCSDMACVRNNYWMWWDGYNPGIPINEVLMDANGTTKYPLFYVLSSIFKNAPVGSIARRVSSTDPGLVTNDDVWMDGVAFVNGNTTEVVLVNPQSSTVSTTSLNGLTGSSANIYQTTSTQNMALVSSPAVTGGTISSITMPAWSVTVVVTSGSSSTSGPAKVNAAGPAVAPFVADADFSGGLTATNWTGAIDTSAVTSPAPQAVYQSERYGASTYTFPGLTANGSYTVRLHFCENYFTVAAARTFNVAINSASVLSNFDIYATAGAIHKANCQQFTVNANSSGQMIIALTNVTNNALINGIEVNPGAPSAPTGLTATAGNSQVALAWNASSGATAYDVKRSTVSGSGYATVSSPTATNYINTGLTNGTAYYFVVDAKNASGTSGNSGQASATPVAVALPIQINAAGPAVAPFVADIDFSGGTTATNWTGAITTTGVTNPAPQAVYQSERYGAMTYTIPGLAAGTTYTVRLHFCENFFTVSGQRTFNVSINNTSVLSNFDIYATAGAIHKANVQQFNIAANASGQEVIAFTNVVNNALVNGIEVTAIGGPPAPTGLTATPGNAQIALSWTASSGATSYNVYRGTAAGGESATAIATGVATTSYTNTGLTNGTHYYYTVKAVNAGGTSGASNEANATPVAPAAPAFVQVASNDPVSATTIVVPFGSAQTAGNLNIVVVGWNDLTGTVSSVTDSAGNTYTRAIGPTVGSGQQQSIYYASNIHAGANTVTVTMSFAADYPDIRVLEYSGVTTLDKTAGASGTSAAPNSGSATTTTARELIFTANTCYPATTGVGTGFTTRVTTTDGDIAADQIVNATGSYAGSATLQSSNFWVMQMATFK